MLVREAEGEKIIIFFKKRMKGDFREKEVQKKTKKTFKKKANHIYKVLFGDSPRGPLTITVSLPSTSQFHPHFSPSTSADLAHQMESPPQPSLRVPHLAPCFRLNFPADF
jgi:hypothetical protein